MVYNLSCSLRGHSSDVRCLAVGPDGTIISGSRDKTAILWKNVNGRYIQHKTLLGHLNFVSAVCVLPPTSAYAFGLIATGSHDSTIRVYEPDSADPVLIFTGHEGAVTCLNPALNTCLLSASWDKTVKLWNTSLNECSMSFEGHLMAVWCVIQIPNGLIISGSADHKIRVFNKNSSLKGILEGHTDCVRGLCHISETIVLSCSNDSSVRRWDIERGECMEILYSHPNYIYSISYGNDGDLVVSGGEDRCVKLWTPSGIEQLTIPAQSVWAVAVMSNSDVIVGSSDGTVRIFSCDTSRKASNEDIIKYDDEVENNANNMTEIGDVKVSDLPGKEALLEQGKYEGHLKIIRGEKGVMCCYKWSAVKSMWEEVGDVVGACKSPSTENKVMHDGKEYDYVFNIDLEDNKPPIKLPYNTCDDPWAVAQEFINVHRLSQGYLAQIATFISTNAVKRPSETVASSTLMDPYTGPSRYIPGDLPAVSGDVKKGILPQTKYVSFDQANVNQIKGKLFEFNNNLGHGTHHYNSGVLEKVIKLAQSDATVDNDGIMVLRDLLFWPEDIVFPVLDIARLAVRNPEVNTALCSEDSGSILVSVLQRFILPEARPANKMLTVRLFANLFSFSAGESLMLKIDSFIVGLVKRLVLGQSSRGLQIACATLLLNYSVAYTQRNDSEGQTLCRQALLEMIHHLDDTEALFRALVAIGTLLCYMNRPLVPNELYETLIKLEKTKANEKIGLCAAEIINTLRKNYK